MPTDPPTASSSRVRMVEALANGTVIDHIPPEVTLKVAAMMAKSGDQTFIGVNLRSGRIGRKGVVKIANREIDKRQASCLALVAPSATVSIIRDYSVVKKEQVELPQRFDDVARCANPNCVTNHERWSTRFAVVSSNPLSVRCLYCERRFDAGALELL